ncbi:TadE/TadG family type IV pilus assembly protein [Roseovarius aestuariivivens]|uniref:TadE/TadG family type IV pilus assembly protein n=1 Tax=Roseovarius aestuariivivens TaxID=1888910 RepID=UPI0010805C72|nr:TadE/TadG family type IV pilus assembly protein [Roseovarius aestuariivivens]
MKIPETFAPKSWYQTDDPTNVRLYELRQTFALFKRDEEGAMTILTLFIFLFMLVMAGLGIDTMRHEMNRAKLQATLDSAVLAGAGAATAPDAEAVVKDYFAKAGMADKLTDISEGDIQMTLNTSSVSASASFTMDTYLMKLSGVEQLSSSAEATAEMRVPKLEIVLVLDVSGSMANNSKIGNLKTAANAFIDKVMASWRSRPGSTVMSIVPFSTSVTPSDGIFKVLAVGEDHTYSNCLYLEENDYTHPSLATGSSSNSSGQNLKQAIYTSMYGGFDDLNSVWRSCYTDEYFQILPYSIDKNVLHAKINSLQAAGNTSTDQGIKYGSALLHPDWREVSSSLIADGVVDASQVNVPADYDEPETLKIMIVMGDGENTTTHFFNKMPSEFRGANSDLHLVTHQFMKFEYAYEKRNRDAKFSSLEYEAYCADSNWVCKYEAYGPLKSAYYLEDPDPTDRDGDGIKDVFYNIEKNRWLSANEFNDLSDDIGFVSSEQVSWETAWGLMSPHYYGEITENWQPWNDYRYAEQITGATKNSRMDNVCTAAKTAGAIIYTIGFEIAEGGVAETALESCASSNSHYYRVEGLDITDAFGSIAGNVQALRLTQ